MKKRMKKSTWIALALLVYVTAVAIYFLPRNTTISDTEKYITLGASYLIVVALWFVLRKKEQFKERRDREANDYDTLNKERE